MTKLNLEELEKVTQPNHALLEAMKGEIERAEASFCKNVFFRSEVIFCVRGVEYRLFWDRGIRRICLNVSGVMRPLIEHKVLERVEGYGHLQELIDKITQQLKEESHE